MSQMCMFAPRYRQKVIVHERQRSEFERRFLWTEPKVDFLQLCVRVLTYELVRSREQLKKAILCILEKEKREEIALREEMEFRERASRQAVQQTRRNNYENVTVQQTQRVKSKTSDGSIDDDIFVYGRDAEKIDQVIKHAMHDIVSTSTWRNLKIASLALSGPAIGNLTSSAYRELLAAEYSKHPKPDVLVIILEEYTSNMFSSFQGSGFVNAKRAAGLDIIIICCSTDQGDAKHASIWREFKHKIFVPSRKDEEPWIPENDEKAAGDNDMVVHKFGGSTDHDAADTRDIIYATVHKNPSRLRENEAAQGRENEMMPKPQENQLAGQYVEVEVQQHKTNNGTINGFSGQFETNPNPIPSRSPSVAAGDFVDSAYSTMHPVMKNPPQPPPKPVAVHQQPRREAEEQPVFWNKGRPDSVALNVEPPAYVGGGRPFDEFPVDEEVSYCDRILNCIVGAYACLLD